MFTTLITPKQLAALQNHALGSVIICDCRFDLADEHAGEKAFLAAHIPGAAWLSLEADLSGPKTGRNGRHPLPERNMLARKLAVLGATETSQIVAYDAADAMFAARLWWLLRWLGHTNVAVLDGGLQAWQQAGLAVTQGTSANIAHGHFPLREPLMPTINYSELSTASNKLIIDARAPDRFAGHSETLDAKSGHIPGASNRWFKQNLQTDGTFKSAETLHDEYALLLNGTPVQTVVSSCGSGVTACHTLLAMEIAGFPGAVLYPGSWSEWSTQPDAPVATGAG